MKTRICFFFLMFAAAVVYAQREEYTWDYITFEEPYMYLTLDTADSNTWEIGTPNKHIFYGSYAGSNSIFTAGEPSYPVNNHSMFTLLINEQNVDHFPYSVYLEFMQQLDTEKGKDGGYIDVSYDGGQSWTNIIKDRSACLCPGDPYETAGLYSQVDTLFNGAYGFSGEAHQWSRVRFGWEYCLTKSESVYGDHMLLRFHFISDGNDTSCEGWNIDHIRLFSMPISGSSADEQAPAFMVTPNPTVNDLRVVATDGSPIKRICLFDIVGNLMQVVERTSHLSLSDHSSGIYVIKIESEAGEAFRKVLKQ